MAVTDSGSVPFQAYARLISVLGDQLISDKWVGVIELVKNSYDADAEKVSVSFSNFGEDKKGAPTIIIEDDGNGMTLDTVLDVWMKPATPNKLNQKKSGNSRLTQKGRVMQGDKGVGRFAIYKLGNQVTLFTKTNSDEEVKLTLNFHEYADDEFVESDHEDKFLDEILNDWEVNDTPIHIKNEKGQGTKIIITDLKDEWKERDLTKLMNAFYRMTPPKLPSYAGNDISFEVSVFWNSLLKVPKTKEFTEFLDRAPFYFEGIIENNGTLNYSYRHNTKKVDGSINFFDDDYQISDHQIWNLKFFRENFLEVIDSEKPAKIGNLKVSHRPSIGQFIFFFYAFDLNNPSEGLSGDDKAFIKEHSVYLFRDNVRVFPFGERGVDWLLLSKYRAEDKAGNYFSYNDLLGFIFITQEENSNLRDAADREGLMNIKGAYDDFVALNQAALKVMKDFVDVDKEKGRLKKTNAQKTLSKQFEDAFDQLRKKILEFEDKDLITKSQNLFVATNNLIEKTKEELKITQELAGTGMAVEKATHDTMSLLKKLKENTEDFVNRFDKNEILPKDLKEFLLELEENLEFLYQELQVLQPLFRVARKVTKDVSVNNVAERVIKYFRKELVGKFKVEIEVSQDVIVKTNTGLILQVLLNLMDNAIYWVNEFPKNEKHIKLVIDGYNNRFIFSDSGPGINEDITDIVFSEFYSRKEEGRGLGLYIAKELLDRIDAEISIITDEKFKVLPGANFIVQFKTQPKG